MQIVIKLEAGDEGLANELSAHAHNRTSFDISILNENYSAFVIEYDIKSIVDPIYCWYAEGPVEYTYCGLRGHVTLSLKKEL